MYGPTNPLSVFLGYFRVWGFFGIGALIAPMMHLIGKRSDLVDGIPFGIGALVLIGVWPRRC